MSTCDGPAHMDQSGWALCCSSANALSQVDSARKDVSEPCDARLRRGSNRIGDFVSDGGYWSKATAVYPILSDLLTLKVILNCISLLISTFCHTHSRFSETVAGEKRMWRCGGSNPGPFTCKANALPLSYIPISSYIRF